MSLSEPVTSRQVHPLYGRSCRLESVQNAVDQVKIVAAALCDQEPPPPTVPWFWSDQFDVKLQTVGLMEGADQLLVRGSPEIGNSFSVWYFAADRLLAVDAINDSVAYAVGSKMLKANVSPLPDKLSDLSCSLKDLLKSTLETS